MSSGVPEVSANARRRALAFVAAALALSPPAALASRWSVDGLTSHGNGDVAHRFAELCVGALVLAFVALLYSSPQQLSRHTAKLNVAAWCLLLAGWCVLLVTAWEIENTMRAGEP